MFQDVSRKLLHYYFSKEIGGADPVRSIDVSGSELAKALEVPKSQAEKRLKYACCEYARVYKRGNPYLIYAEGNISIYGLVIFLLFACKIAQKAGENESKNFQECLKDSFAFSEGGHPPYSLNSMWNSLVIWCSKNPKYREIILPKEVLSRKHINRTQDITFPTWRDESSLNALISLKGRSSLNGIERDLLAAQYCPPKATPAFRVFFEQYIELLKKKDPLRHEMLFGKFVRKSFGISHPNLIDEDLDPLDLVLTTTSFYQKKELRYGDDRWTNVANGLRALVKKLPRQSLLKKQLYQKVLVFEKTGHGEYTAVCSPELDRIVIVYSDDHSSTFDRYGSHHLGGRWFLTKEVSFTEKMRKILGKFCHTKTPFFCLEGGVRHRTSILRNVALAPRVYALRNGKMRIGVNEVVNCKAGNHYTIGSKINSGELPIYFYSGKSSSLRMLRVYDSAPIIPISSLSDWSWISYEEFDADRQRDAECHTEIVERTSPSSNQLTLEEALYFKGRSGLSTKDLIELFEMILPEDGPRVWDVIRSFIEGGWLTPYWARRYGVMKYQVVRPHFVELGDKVALWGARPKSIVECFIKRVEARGGSVTVRNGVGSYSPQFFEASGVSAKELKEICTEPHVWGEVKEKPLLPVSFGKIFNPNSLDKSISNQYVPTYYWNWRSRKFSKKNEKHWVEIRILKHPENEGQGAKFHTLYEVLVNGKSLITTYVRNTALIYAYNTAGKELFVYDNYRLFRLGNEGYLPAPIAKGIAFTYCCCGGPVYQENRWQYAYALDNKLVDYLGNELGVKLLSGVPVSVNPVPGYHYPSSLLRRHRPEIRNRYRG